MLNRASDLWVSVVKWLHVATWNPKLFIMGFESDKETFLWHFFTLIVLIFLSLFSFFISCFSFFFKIFFQQYFFFIFVVSKFISNFQCKTYDMNLKLRIRCVSAFESITSLSTFPSLAVFVYESVSSVSVQEPFETTMTNGWGS